MSKLVTFSIIVLPDGFTSLQSKGPRIENKKFGGAKHLITSNLIDNQRIVSLKGINMWRTEGRNAYIFHFSFKFSLH